MRSRERPKTLLVSAGSRRRERVREELEADGYDVAALCAGPDGDRHCPGLSEGRCEVAESTELVVLDVASINGVGALQALYASRGLPVRARGAALRRDMSA
jgi:hypothetical protein